MFIVQKPAIALKLRFRLSLVFWMLLCRLLRVTDNLWFGDGVKGRTWAVALTGSWLAGLTFVLDQKPAPGTFDLVSVDIACCAATAFPTAPTSVGPPSVVSVVCGNAELEVPPNRLLPCCAEALIISSKVTTMLAP